MGAARWLVALALVPACLLGQEGQEAPEPTSARDGVGWHWFGSCKGRDSLALEVRLDGQSIFSSTFPICQLRRSQIKHDGQQRLLTFRFTAAPRRFGYRSKVAEPQTIDGNIWEARGAGQALRLGVSFATGDQVLLNMTLIAPTNLPTRYEQPRGLVITTRPVRPPK